MKTVIAGDPHSGKSIFVEGLKKALKKLGVYPYVLTANPDGEEAWFQEAYKNNPEIARRLKEEYKKKFTPEFVERVRENVRNIKLDNVLIDVGGKITPENYRICEFADSIIILSNSASGIPKWEQFANDLKLKVIAKIVSDLNAKEDTVNMGDPITGVVHHLKRGEDASDRPMVKAVAAKLAGKSFKEEKKEEEKKEVLLEKKSHDWVGMFLGY